MKRERVRKLLLEDCESYSTDYGWHWLSDHPRTVSMRRANKFLLGARIDYGIKADWAWESAEILSEIVLGDPDDLWSAIASMGLDELEVVFKGKHVDEGCLRCAAGHQIRVNSASSGAVKRHKMFHMWPDRAANDVWRTMQIISNRYGGDARRIWDGQPISEILQRLEDATFGPNLSHMVVGALMDTKQIEGRGNLKADINVTRVLGRVFTGSKTTPDEAHRIADTMEPGNTWIFDRRLFGLGQNICISTNPRCEECCLNHECTYNSGRERSFI